MVALLDFAAIGRILAATVEAAALPERYRIPERNPDIRQAETDLAQVRAARTGLANSIKSTFEMPKLIGEHGSDKGARDRSDNLAKISAHLKSVQDLLEDDRPLRASITRHLATQSTALSALEEIRDVIKVEQDRLRELGLSEVAPHVFKDLRDAGFSGQPALIVGFAKLYEDVFGHVATIKYNTARESDGPFIRFVQTIYAELKIEKPNPDTIRKNLQRGIRLRDA